MITCHSENHGEQTVSLNGQSTEGFCFDYWYQKTRNNIAVRFYIDETLHEIVFEFTEQNGSHRINIADYV